MSLPQPDLRFALLCDRGKLRLGNEDAGFCDRALGLFAVSDGMGGLPAGGAASQVLVQALPQLIRPHAATLDPEAEDQTVHTTLTDAITTLSRSMFDDSRRCPGLVGWGATVVAMWVRGNRAHITHVGDSRAYLLREKFLVPLTDDHSYISKLLAHGQLITEEYEQQNRNLVSQHVAMRDMVTPGVRTIRLKAGDRLLLCTDGLTSMVEEKAIGRTLLGAANPDEAAAALIEQANAAGGMDNITALVIDFHGLVGQAAAGGQRLAASDELPGNADDLPVEDLIGNASGLHIAPNLPPLVRQTHQLLTKLEGQLRWLEDGASEIEAARDDADQKVVELIGKAALSAALERFPDDEPIHSFHRVCTDPRQIWRQHYQASMQQLEPLIHQLLSPPVRLSPLLSGEGAASIVRSLWQEYRGIERRYFVGCQRGTLRQRERSLAIIIDHLRESTRTLAGLLQFLPTFRGSPREQVAG